MSEKSETQTWAEIEHRIDERFAHSFAKPILSKSPLSVFLYGFSLAFIGYHLWYAYSAGMPRNKFVIVHLGFILSFWGLSKLHRADRDTTQGQLIILGTLVYVLASVLSTAYIFINYRNLLVFRAGIYNQTDILVGAMVTILVLIAIWNVSRLIFVVTVVGLIYSYFGPYMPGVLNHAGLSIERIIAMNTVEMNGIFGPLLQVTATWVLAFLVLAAFIEMYGGMNIFIKGITKLVGRSKVIEVGQVAVLASMVMGSINGSTAANTATTGAFTIPLMKENGYEPRLAAAVESVASSGGQVLPPVMGAGAFLMAEFIEPSYTDIIIASAIPAIMLYLIIALSISLNSGDSSSIDVSGLQRRTLGRYLMDVFKHFEYMVMFAVLMYYLVYLKVDPMLAGLYSTITLVILRLVRMLVTRENAEVARRSQMQRFGRETIEAMRRSVELTLEISIIMASLGMIIRAFIVTGFAQQLSTYLVIASGGVQIALLFMAMLSAIIFGMGMSTGPAYMIVAILVAPALTTTGIPALKAHLFVFYFAVVSNITPPIALAVAIAHGIAGANFWDASVDALKIGFPLFVLPYAFFFNPSLMYINSMTLLSFLLVLIALGGLSIGFSGGLSTPIKWPIRLGFTALGTLIVFLPAVIGEGMILPIQIGLTAVLMTGLAAIFKQHWYPLVTQAMRKPQ